MKKLKIKPIFFMVFLTIFFITILAFINEITADRISLNEEISLKSSFLYTVNINIEDKSAEEIDELYNIHINEITVKDYTMYEFIKDDEIKGYVIKMSDSAVWGELNGLIGINAEFTELLGVDFISHSETPGLGGRIDEKDFKEQFRGYEIDMAEIDNILEYNSQVQAISGATGTSNAVRRIINNEIQFFFNEVKEEL